MRKFLFSVAGVVLVGLCCLTFGCSNLGYYLQSANGQIEVLSKRRPIVELLTDDSTPQELKQRLQLALEIRDFAVSQLGLPDNESYRSYADLQRPFAVWNVVATPEFSLTPISWCFPVVGCLPYRGYYHEADAGSFSAELRRQGHDTTTYGVAAYSTLNWFADPVLNTFSGYSEGYLAGMIFHELAHQQVYVPGNADFNEAYAETVEKVGVARWFAHNGNPQQVKRAEDLQQKTQEFVDLALQTKTLLNQLYQSSIDRKSMRVEKSKLLLAFQDKLRRFRIRHQLKNGYERWLAPDLNNALFSSISTYHDLAPAFEQLLVLKGGDMKSFHLEVQRIAGLELVERDRVMRHLTNISLTTTKGDTAKTL